MSVVARRAGALAAAGLAVAAVLAPAPPSSAATTYTATADARLVAVDLTTVPGVLFDQIVDAGYDVAQAQLDSLGQSNGFASNPYPSETVVLLPGLVAGLTEGASSDVVPPYPLIASSSHPTAPDQRTSAGALVLEASSRAASSRAQATDSIGRSVAEVGLDGSTGVVVARAETSLASLPLSSALTLHGIRSVAEARLTPAGEIERTSSFELAALTVLGQRIALAGGGLELGGEAVPVPGGTGALLGPLLGALADQGTTVELLPAIETDDGITSGGLRITSRSVPPPELAAGVEEVVTAVTVGASTASVSGRVLPVLRPPSLEVAGPGAVPAAPAGGIGGGAPGATSPATPSRATPPVGTAPATSGLTGSTPAASPIATIVGDISLGAFYPVLVAAGLVLVAAVNLFRRFAVRTP